MLYSSSFVIRVRIKKKMTNYHNGETQTAICYYHVVRKIHLKKKQLMAQNLIANQVLKS